VDTDALALRIARALRLGEICEGAAATQRDPVVNEACTEVIATRLQGREAATAQIRFRRQRRLNAKLGHEAKWRFFACCNLVTRNGTQSVAKDRP